MEKLLNKLALTLVPETWLVKVLSNYHLMNYEDLVQTLLNNCKLKLLKSELHTSSG